MKPFLVPILTVPLLLTACDNTPAANPPVDTDAVMAAINEREQAQIAAFEADDAEGATAVYASDATFAATGMPLMSGAQAIRGVFDAMIGDPGSGIEMTPVAHWVSASGDYVTTTSNYLYSYTGPDGTVVKDTGFNQTLWRKEGDTWKIVVDSNTSVTPADEAEPDPTASEEAAAS